MTTAHIEVAHVYTALAAILKSLSVPKGGVLPGNMGGKPYITAVDAAAEVKRQFVENDLIFLPNEEVIKHENITTADRAVKITIVVKGTYEIVSIVDGSSVTVSGTGDGLANGTAVASNIASTNALKNAMLRLFLITEQSVEDESKNGPAEPKPSTTQALNKARNAPTAATPPAPSNEDPNRAKVRTWIGTDDARKKAANDAQDKFKKAGKSGADLWAAVAGEVGA